MDPARARRHAHAPHSEDLDASLAAVRAAGGTIVSEPFEFPGGRRFHFADPSGNELVVWASG